jgi:hypothetical protein
MNFKRHEVQEFIEYELRCFDLSKWPTYKQQLTLWEVTNNNISSIHRCMLSDLNSYYFKALQTFFQAVHEIKQKKYSWAIVKLYYSTFYMLRCEILLANHILVKCNSLFFTKVEVNARLKLFNKNNVRGDHQQTIAFSKKLYDEGEITDPIFGNDIDNLNAYLWLMKNRERVNYQMKDFSDPYHDDILNHIISYFEEDKVSKLFEFYKQNTDYSICFDIEHSILSIPFKKLTQLHIKLKDKIDYKNEFKRKIVTCLNYASELKISKINVIEFMK